MVKAFHGTSYLIPTNDKLGVPYILLTKLILHSNNSHYSFRPLSLTQGGYSILYSSYEPRINIFVHSNWSSDSHVLNVDNKIEIF